MRVHVETHGCAVTQGEARVMEALLEQRGHELSAEPEADAHVLVTCTVVERTQRDMEQRIAALRDTGKPLLVTGCMARASRAQREPSGGSGRCGGGRKLWTFRLPGTNITSTSTTCVWRNKL